jgi:hypothetical protein
VSDRRGLVQTGVLGSLAAQRWSARILTSRQCLQMLERRICDGLGCGAHQQVMLVVMYKANTSVRCVATDGRRYYQHQWSAE